MFFYSVTFGGFVGLASSLTIYFNDVMAWARSWPATSRRPASSWARPVRPIGGYLADRIGGIKSLCIMYAVAAASLIIVSFGLPQAWMALIVFACAMQALGMGNGAVFQLVPQRFRREIGVMTGLVGMSGGIGGFYLASSLGLSKQWLGNYQAGFLIFAALALLALFGLTSVKTPLADDLGCRAMTAAKV